MDKPTKGKCSFWKDFFDNIFTAAYTYTNFSFKTFYPNAYTRFVYTCVTLVLIKKPDLVRFEPKNRSQTSSVGSDCCFQWAFGASFHWMQHVFPEAGPLPLQWSSCCPPGV